MKNVYARNVKAGILKGLYPLSPLRGIGLYLLRNQDAPRGVPLDASVHRRNAECRMINAEL